MRNLKKILALVLALIMSLSLMATAGASSFPDVDDDNPYANAIEVLDALKVFQGYKEDGTFRPTETLNRAQAAVLVYRVATGDVEDKYLDNYTYMQQSKFTDLDGYNWAKGYINYCQNAGIVIGTTATTFEPGAKVTGYQLLVMLLRTLGYGKAGEFADPKGWELQTATIAEREGILKNVTKGDLGAPAPRQMVAEILFRGLLTPTVEYSTFTAGGYTKGETLGKREFSLEEVTGVVVANEYAGILRGDNVTTGKNPAAKGHTVLWTKDGKAYDIDTASGLDDLGETRVAYTTKASGRDDYNIKCVALIDPDTDNIVYEGGDQKDNLNGLGIRDTETERYINFGESGNVDTTTIKVTYQVESITRQYSNLNQAGAIAAFRSDFQLNASANVTATFVNHAGSGSYNVTYVPGAADINDTDGVADNTVTINGHTYSNQSRTVNGVTSYFYVVEIQPGATYTAIDQAVVRAIFNRGNLLPDTVTGLGSMIVRGEVYRGTQSLVDYSDTNNYDTFVANCIDLADVHVNANIGGNSLGWWLKVIDNDKDGVTDWVFQTRYTVAKVSAVNAETGALTLDTTDWETAENLRTQGRTTAWDGNDSINSGRNITATNESGETLAVGDVVYYAKIDGTNRAWKCDVIEGRVSSINRQARTVTVDGQADPIKESAVHEHSVSTDINSFVSNMSGTVNMKLYLDKFGNMAAFSQNINGSFALLTNGWARSVINGSEFAVTAWDSADQALKQYNVTEGGSSFIFNALDANSWNRIRPFTGLNCVNNTHTAANDDIHTIVAYMEADGENARLLPVDTVYDVERQNGREIRMIDLDTTIPGSGLVNTGRIYSTSALASLPYNAAAATATTRVRALSNTLYYYVYQSYQNSNGLAAGLMVKQFTGYADGASWLSAADRQYVEDVYVVGTRSEDVAGTYYTANVVVIEMDDNFRPETHKDNEQVFIYNIPTTVGWNTIEEVDAIRADGSNQKIKIDLAASRTYTEAEETNQVITPGLYWLHRTTRTASENIWAVEHMHHEDIRAAGIYDVGEVYSSDFNLPNDYVQVTDWICKGGAGHHTEAGTHAVVVDTANPANNNPVAAAINDSRRDVAGTSKYYSLSYDNTNRWGTVTEGTASSVLRQWFNYGSTADNNRNQVLVRYNAQGNIVYAISFDHLASGLNENYAQQVWRSVLLDANKGPAADRQATVTFNFRLFEANGTTLVTNGDRKPDFTRNQTIGSTRTYNFTTDSEFVMKGYEVFAVRRLVDSTPTSTTVTPAVADAAGVVADVAVGPLNGNITVQVDYRVAQYELKLDGAGFATGITVNTPVAGTAIAGGATATYDGGAEYVVTVPMSAGKGYTAQVTATTGGAVLAQQPVRKVLANGDTTFTGRITQDTTIKITEVTNNITTNLVGGTGTNAPADVQYAINGVVQTGVTVTSGGSIRGAVEGDTITFSRTGAAKNFFVKAGSVFGGTVCTTKEPVTSYAYTTAAASDRDTLIFYEPIEVQLINSVSPNAGTLGIAVDLLGNQGNVPGGSDPMTVTTKTIFVPYSAVITGTLTPGAGVTGTFLNVDTGAGASTGTTTTATTSGITAKTTVNFGTNT